MNKKYKDIDPQETTEWIESLKSIIKKDLKMTTTILSNQGSTKKARLPILYL